MFGRKKAKAQLQAGIEAARTQQRAAAAAAAGAPMTAALVTGIQDTGTLVNYDPVVVLLLTIQATGQPISLETLVSKVQIPRVGDVVGLIPNPAAPGTYAYARLLPS